MVGIVVVSHSERLADGVVELAREMGGADLVLEAAGGIGEPGVLGTDADRVRGAIERAMSPDGVLVVMDLGSALMSAEFAVELLADTPGPVRLSGAPLVEGTVAAAVAAAGGGALDEVAQQARGALAMKAAQLGADGSGGDSTERSGASEAGVGASDAGAGEAGAGEAGAGEADAGEAGAGEADAGAEAPPDAQATATIRNALGIHARPAARVVAAVRNFDAAVSLAKAPGGRLVSARSLTDVVALSARRGDTIDISAHGPEAQAAVDALRELVDEGFGEGIVESARPTADGSQSAGARAGAGGDGGPDAGADGDADAGAEPASPPEPGALLTGVSAAQGVAIGPARPLRVPPTAPPEREPVSPDEERARLQRALEAARTAVEADRETVAERAGRADAAIFEAHLALLEDEAMTAPALAAVASGATAEQAWYDAAQQTAARYRGLEDPLLRERATDVEDIGRRVVGALTGASARAPVGGVVVADELTPADAAGLDPERVHAIVTARGTATAHGAILARALGLPAVVGLGPAILAVPADTTLLVDGEAGTVTIDPPPDRLEDARGRQARAQQRRARARAHAHEAGCTADGRRIEVFANLGSAADARRAVEHGAEGVGLLRTEFLFLERPQLPDEEEQAETLREIARALDGRPLIVRTLDAGADKPLPALPMPPEANPFLGVRGLRLALRRRDVLATQLRAILRVAAEHPVKAMLPMVSTAEELAAARRELELAREQTGVDAPLELGIMIEVPAAALTAATLARQAEFFSVGTNDLTQYTMAAERGDARLASLLTGPQPAVLALIDIAVRAAEARDRPVGVCGELAGDPPSALLLAGLGVTELSMAPALVPDVKAALREVDFPRLRDVAGQALRAPDAASARALAAALL